MTHFEEVLCRFCVGSTSKTATHGSRWPYKSLSYNGLAGAPGMIRTCDLLVRSQTLYPAELRALTLSVYQAKYAY